MKITRLQVEGYRGWRSVSMTPKGHVVLVGEPRAGRSDLVAALRCVLDPMSTRRQPSATDLFRVVEKVPGTRGPLHAPSSLARIEVTLADLPYEVELESDTALEPLDANGWVVTSEADEDAKLGLRLTYQLTYDPETDSLEHFVYYPSLSDVENEVYRRAPMVVRRALPVLFLDADEPLQLRAEGMLRRLITEGNEEQATRALRNLQEAISVASSTLAATASVAPILDAIFNDEGPARRLADAPASAANVEFLPEDGSLAGVLRSLQAHLVLDSAGLLPISRHGSTARGVLAAAETKLLAEALGDAILIADDLGEGVDSPTAEHLGMLVRHIGVQAIITTRCPDVARAFALEEVIRLTRHRGERRVHYLPPTADKKEASVRRHAHVQLLPALSAATVAISEGRHDLSTLGAADRLRGLGGAPLAAQGIRLITAETGSGGGTGMIPRVARLATSLGYRVIAIVDGDPPKNADVPLQSISDSVDAVVRLPENMAIERAITSGFSPGELRVASQVFASFGIPDPTDGKDDASVHDAVKKCLHKQGLHESFMESLYRETERFPPVVADTLDAVGRAGAGGYDGPKLIQLVV